MDQNVSEVEIRDDDELDALLSLQTMDGQEDDPLLQMLSSSSCLSISCS